MATDRPVTQGPGVPAVRLARTNLLAIVSIVGAIGTFAGFVLIGSIIAVVSGHVARRQIKQSGERGARFALVGLILGYTQLVLTFWYLAFALIMRSLIFFSGQG
jgi:hypothetical protein